MNLIESGQWLESQNGEPIIQMFDDIAVCGAPVDELALEQIRRCRPFVEKAAMMADHHGGMQVPIGGVIACREHVSVSAVGMDISCGNKAVRLDAPHNEVRKNISKIMDDIVKNISFGVGRINNTEVDNELFDSSTWRLPAVAPHKEMARQQLGTIGSSNHFVDIFVDEQDRIWVGVHFGSRGLGAKTATWFLEQIGAKDDMNAEPAMLHDKSNLGAEYLECIEMIGKYAYAGRDWVCQEVARIIGADIVEEIHNHHNFAFREGDYWVMRKGSTPAFPEQKCFVGGSMGENSVILEGVQNEYSDLLMNSTVHGAGRVMSRTKAKGKTNRKTGEILSPGLVSQEMMNQWMTTAGVELRGGDLDESPHAYKRLREVLAYHTGTVKIIHALKPIGVAMAGQGSN
jgi:tRNA-splicing ligase RtcB